MLDWNSCYRAQVAEMKVLQSFAIMHYESRRPFASPVCDSQTLQPFNQQARDILRFRIPGDTEST